MRIRSGVDLVATARIAAYLTDGDDLHRAWTTAELDLCRGSADQLAGRLAAKEAVCKTLGVGLDTVDPTEIEVLRGEGGEPVLVLADRPAALAEDLGITAWSVSISHEAGLAIAFVVAIAL